MNEYRFADMQPGLSERFTVTVEERDHLAFREVSGDISPLHVDEEYAKERGFEGRVVPGLLTASYYSRLVGVHLPGKNALLHGVKVTFHNPVYVGDTLEVYGEVSHVNEAYRQIEIKCRVTSESGVKISSGTIKAGVAE